MNLSPTVANGLANALLILHVGIVLFVVLGECLLLLGNQRGWHWVRHRRLRLVHLALMVFIAVQTWLGRLCPLTAWEQDLRRISGAGGYTGSFIEHWLSRLLYWEAPWWVFVATYSAFALLVVATWYWVRPRAA